MEAFKQRKQNSVKTTTKKKNVRTKIVCTENVENVYFSSQRKSIISTIYLCLSVLSNRISLSKLSVEVLERFALATHFMAKGNFVSCNKNS